jgi:PAS domain S-box-containing protein
MAELLCLTVSDICPDVPPSQFADNVETLAHGPLPVVQAWTRRKDGALFLCEVSTARVDVGGEVYLFGVARDVTERTAAARLRNDLATQLLQTIERERQRVARELHDDVGQALATVGVLLDALEVSPGAVPATVEPSLLATRRTITRITESLARIVREYHPAELLGLGLEDTLRSHARQLARRHELTLDLTTEPVGEGLLSPDQELHVYRVVQEALGNAARHGAARRIAVTLARSDEHLVVTVRDDGTGFDAGAHPERGVGLATMRERALLLHGALTVESGFGRGTTVRLTVPFAAPAVPEEPPPARPVVPTVADPGPVTATADVLPPALDREVFRRMADMSSEAFLLADVTGRFHYVNDRACTLTGFSRPELLAMSVSDLNPDYPPEAWRRWVSEAVRGPLPAFETRNRRKDGSVFPVEVSVACIDAGGAPHFFGVVRDITDRKETEAAQQGFTRRLLHTLEAERRRVARDLHDEVGQAIAAVGVLLHALDGSAAALPAELREGLAATQATIRQITESVARIVRDYHPAELLELGLEDTLRTHAHQFSQRHGLRLRLATTPVGGLLSDERALHVFRIVQEALANVARHAHARHVSVRLARQGGRVLASVRDDGIGFDARRTRAGGLGLVTMRERAALIGGALDVRSTPGRATEVRLSVAIDAASPA